MPIPGAEVAPVTSRWTVDVFHEVARLIESSRTQVNRQHHLGADCAAPFGKFVNAYCIAFRGVPCEVEAGWPQFTGTDAVLPVVGRHEVPARIANKGDFESRTS